MAAINWFTPNEMLTYNCLFNFVVGDRGGGKSFGSLKFCIDRFKKAGEEFIYLRRTKEELKKSLPKVFDALIVENKYPEDNLSVSGRELKINGKVMGYGMALSTAAKDKSIPFPRIKWIIFEEFMVDGVSNRYLGPGDAEVDMFNNLYETISRLRPPQEEPRVLFIANAFSMVNIYFTYYKINQRMKPPYKKYTRLGDIMVCMWQDENYRQAKKETRFYNLVKDTQFAEHAYENKFFLDSDHFIRKKSPDSEFHFALFYMEKTYGVWVDWNKGEYYISSKAGPQNGENTIALSLEDNRPNNINIRRVRQMPFMVGFRRAVDENRVFYDNAETYANINEAVYLLRTIT